MPDGYFYIEELDNKYKIASPSNQGGNNIIEIDQELNYNMLSCNSIIINSQTAFINTNINYLECKKNDYVVINNPTEIPKENKWKESYIVHKGKKYENVCYLFTLYSYHLVAQKNNQDKIVSYYLLDPKGKICFSTKEPDSCKIKYSDYETRGSFHIIGQNGDDIVFYSTKEGDKARLKNTKEIKLLI